MTPATPSEILKQLISIPSVNPMGRDLTGAEFFETRLSLWLTEFLQDHELPWESAEVAAGRTNLLSRLDGNTHLGTILLDVHQDTVPVDGMTIPPFEPATRDGRIYGRGACDVKGGMAAMLAAFVRLKQTPAAERPSVVLSLTVDEESTSLGINHLTQSWEGKTTPYRLCPDPPTCAIVAEPTELELVVAHKGAVRWTISTSGRACHSSSPNLGISAVYAMAKIVTLLESYAETLPRSRPAHHLCGPATLNVGLISGGSSVNVVPDHCQIHVDRRVLPGETALQAREEIINWLHAQTDIPLTHAQPYCQSPPLADEHNQEAAQRLLKSVHRYDSDRRIIGVPFGTHASRLAAVGVPAVVFGPGSIDQAHTKDEWIDEQQLHAATEILFDFCSNH
jgi:acetylornithine deacetylase